MRTQSVPAIKTAYTNYGYEGEITGRSTSGVLGMWEGLIFWYTQKQHLVATLVAEVEYRAAVSSIHNIFWLRRIEKELAILNTDKPTIICTIIC